jgi:hypothetical protein
MKGDTDKHKIVWMSPKEYLTVVPLFQSRLDGTLWKQSPSFYPQRVKEIINYYIRKGIVTVPWLDVEKSRVTGQEGRQITIAAMMLGVEKMPVVIRKEPDTYLDEYTIKHYAGSFEPQPTHMMLSRKF